MLNSVQEARMSKTSRTQVRAENPSGACGKLDHMTIDELKARAVGDDFDGTCPACGKFHLTRAEIEKLESQKIVESESYQEMKKEAEAAE
jgi:Zn-finger nucleic acid-binding protein